MSEHRYWQLNCQNYSGSYCRVAELQLRTIIDGETVTGSGIASASSELSGSYSADKAFDNDVNTQWIPSVVPSQLIYDFGIGNVYDIKEIQIQIATAGQGPTFFSVGYSDDGLNWTYSNPMSVSQWVDTNEIKIFQPTWPSVGQEIGPHNMTSVNTPSPFVISTSSQYDNDTYGSWKAFNNNNSDCWNTDSGVLAAWIKVDLGVDKICGVYSIQAYIDPTRSPSAWTFEGSNDNSNWSVLDTRSDQTGWTISEMRSFIILSPGSYRYYRINISANDGSANYLAISEIYLYEGIMSYEYTNTLSLDSILMDAPIQNNLNTLLFGDI